MRLYTGMDLHSSSSYLAIIDETGNRVFKKHIRVGSERIPRAACRVANNEVDIGTIIWYYIGTIISTERSNFNERNCGAGYQKKRDLGSG